jgi:hypothetical protein
MTTMAMLRGLVSILVSAAAARVACSVWNQRVEPYRGVRRFQRGRL